MTSVVAVCSVVAIFAIFAIYPVRAILTICTTICVTFSILTALSTKLTYLLSTAATAPQPSPWWRPSAAPLPSLPTVTLASRLADASRIGLPIALSAVAARRTAQLGDSGLLAGVLAGALTVAYDGAGIAALIGGYCAGLSCRRVRSGLPIR